MRPYRLGTLLMAAAAALTVTSTIGVPQAAASTATAPLFTPVTPVRVLDTRSGLGTNAGRVGPGGTVDLNLSGSVPAATTAVVLNLTGVDATGSTYLTAKPTGSSATASNVNLAPGDTRSNEVTVAVNSDRIVVLGNHAGSIDVVADLAGYYSPGTGSGYTALTPDRVLDTRDGTGRNGTAAPVGQGATISLDLSGVVPATATAVTFNLTALDATSTTYVETWPDGDSQPTVSSLNPTPGAVTPILVTVALGQNHRLNLFNHAGTVDLVADLAGYYATDRGDSFYPVSPHRVLDTRTPPAPLRLGETRLLDLSSSLPADASAAVYNLTGTDTTDFTYVTAWPAGKAAPLASNLNLAPSQTAANLAITALTSPGQIDLFNHAGTVDLVADLAGYFAPAPTSVPPPPPANGTVTTWGTNDHDQLGYPTPTDQGTSTPTQVPGVSGVKQLVSGFATAYTLLTNGTVQAWGRGDLNGLGNGTSTNSLTPVPVSGLTGITQISAGADNGYALDSAHHVWAWGDNEVGELGIGTTDPHLTPVQVPLPGPAVSVVGDADNTAYALLADGTVWSWGQSEYGQLGNGTVGFCGPLTACQALSPVQVGGLTGVVALYASTTDGYAVKSDGTVWAWGWNAEGELAVGTAGGQDCYSTQTGANCAAPTPVPVPSLTGVTRIAGTYAIRSDGSVLAWGDDTVGDLDGTARGYVGTPFVLTSISQVRDISVGLGFTVAVRTDGTVWIWGENTFQEYGSWASGQPPVQFPGLANVLDVSNGWYYIALLS